MSLARLNSSAPGQHLGTYSNGQVITRAPCANNYAESAASGRCFEQGTLTCSKCHLAKYCSSQCQTQHWSTHKKVCKHSYMDPAWKPAWVTERRSPAFVNGSTDGLQSSPFGPFGNYLWGNVTAINCLQVARNEGQCAASMDLKLCFAASGDLRNLIMTVNDLPENYEGRCDVLLNDFHSIVANRNLVILYVLLSGGADIAEAAELAVHLMYSAALTPEMASYVRRCIDAIYSSHESQGGSWDTRGTAKIRSLQRFSDMNFALQMFHSTYKLSDALSSMRSVMLNNERVDYRDRHMTYLKPNHRMAFSRFRSTGVLAPFTIDVSHFTEPNRLLFSPDGRWLALDDANPLRGWDLRPVFEASHRYGTTNGDTYGSFFFYAKEELQKFATRAKKFRLNITLTQDSAQSLSQKIATGSVLGFVHARFDRIETSNISDENYCGAARVVEDWAPLLNRENSDSALMLYFMNWRLLQPNATAKGSGYKLDKETIERTANALGTHPKQALVGGVYSPQVFHFMECMETFYDSDGPFSEYLKEVGIFQAAAAKGVRLRSIHRIHPKRTGLTLEDSTQNVPNLARDEFYNLFLLGGANNSDRFVEVEVKV